MKTPDSPPHEIHRLTVEEWAACLPEKRKTEQINLAIERLRHALEDSRNLPVAYPVLANMGLMTRTANGFRAIDPRQVISRCREAIARLEGIL